MNTLQHRRRRTALLVVLAGTAALALQSLLTSQSWEGAATVNHLIDDVEEDEDEGEASIGEIDEHTFRRMLLNDEDIIAEDADVLAIPGLEEDVLHLNLKSIGNTILHPAEIAALEESANASTEEEEELIPPYDQLIDDNQPLPHYNIEDAVESSKMYDNTFAFLIYDPAVDEFVGHYSRRHFWVAGCEKLLSSFKYITYMLRENFPERFKGAESDELVIPISSGDYPQVKITCLDHWRHDSTNPNTPPGWVALMKKGCNMNTAPILHFGSVFRQPYMFPSMIAMPMPEPHHLYCFENYLAHSGGICNHLRPAGHAGDRKAELVFGKEFGLEWEDLIPQVVWRGTDFSYLTKVHPYLKKPVFNKEQFLNWPYEGQSKMERLTNKIGGGLTARAAAIKRQRLERVRKRAPFKAAQSDLMLQEFSRASAVTALRGQFDKLLPRWKAVVLTAEAETQAATKDLWAKDPNSKTLPWANMKFSSFVHNGSKSRTTGAELYKDWESIGFATGKYMGLPELAKYKYQIDLAGGGGTTWSGTMHKLAMPGLLFHHMTPTKDYIHDWMKPWVHFVPVSSDLRDLKRKFDWAEAHPVESKQMADEATKLMRYLTSHEGYGEMFQKDIVEPLRRVIEAYQPIKKMHSETGWRNWKEALRRMEGDDRILPVIRCTAITIHNCEVIMERNMIRGILTQKNMRHLYGG